MRKFVVVLVALSCLGIRVAQAQVQFFPSKQVTIIVPTDPGGLVDLLARTVGHGLSEAWRQPVVVQNLPGATYQIGTSRVAKSAPDGYTLLVVPETAFVANQFLFSKLSYDPNQFAPVTGLVAVDTTLVVHAALPIQTMAQLFDAARKDPGKLRFATFGLGSNSHLFLASLESMAGVQFTPVHYKGVAAGLTDVMAGHVEVMFANPNNARGAAKQGKVRILGTTGKMRLPGMPEVSVIAELVPGYEAVAWFGLFAPPGTPVDIVEKISAETRRIIAGQAFQEKLVIPNGFRPIASTPREFQDFIRAETQKWGTVVKAANIKIE